MTRWLILLSLVALLCMGLMATASSTELDPEPPAYESGPWVYTGGPIGGLGYDVRMDPNNPDIMYVTDAWAGVFKSINGGATWAPSNQGIDIRIGPTSDGIPVFSLTIDPNNSNRLWAGTQATSGVYRSDDAGATWTLMNNGILEMGLSVRGFTVEPGNSNVVYLAGEIGSLEWNGSPLPGLGLDMTKGAVYKTVDGGQNWSRIWLGDNLARYIWINPQNHNQLFVSTGIFDREAANSDPVAIVPGGVGILRSDDGGQNWDVLDEANGLDEDELYIGSLYMHPITPTILLAAAGNDPYTPFMGKTLGGVYRTADGGDTWTEMIDGHNFSVVEICEGDPNIAYAGSLSGFFQSTDAGLTWTQLVGANWGPDDAVAGFPIDAHCDPRNPQRVFVNNYGGGNFVSEDGGQTWVVSSQGYTGALMRQIAVAPGDSAVIYASARSGLFGSHDGGENWFGLAYGPARMIDGFAIALDPADPGHLLATHADRPNPIVSWDEGRSWTEVETGLWTSRQVTATGSIVTRLVFAPSNSQRVYATAGIFECLNSFQIDDCGANGLGIIYSEDSGQDWARSNLTDTTVTDLVVSPEDPMRAYAATYDDGLYRTVNGGQNWTLVTSDPTPAGITPTVAALALISGDPDTLLAGYNDGGVAISINGGVSWNSSSNGMPAEADVYSLVVDPSNPDILYAGALNSGVYYSVNGGAEWTILNDGLLSRAARDLAISSDGTVLYMASEGAGIFRLGTPPARGGKLFLPLIQNNS